MTAEQLQLARQCFHFANLAYEEAHVDEPSTSTQLVFGGLPNDPDVIFVGVRGTKEPRDFLTDARFGFKAKFIGSELMRIHRGVNAAVESVFERVLARVRDFKTICVAGHSLGGMIAQPLALKLKLEGMDIGAVQTFGSPRVGNDFFRNAYNALLGNITTRWEAQGDPFPYSPPLICNYRHVERAAYLKNDGRVIFEPTLVDHLPAFVQQAVRLPANITTSALFGIFDPHHRTNYKRLFDQLEATA